MKKTILLFILSLYLALEIEASELAFEPRSVIVGGGERFSVTLKITNLEKPLAGYALDLIFDPYLLKFESLAFGGGFGSGTDAFSFVDSNEPGVVSLGEFSFLPDSALTAIQGEEFVLAAVTFTAITSVPAILEPYPIEFVNIGLEDIVPGVSFLEVNQSGQTEQALIFKKGWNMFSIRVTPSDTSIASVLAPLIQSVRCKKVWALIDNNWHLFMPGKPGISDLAEIKPGQTYYIEVSADCALSVSGAAASGPISLSPGWRAPGYLGAAKVPIGQALESIAGKYSRVWSISDGVWRLYVPGKPEISDLTELSPGQGLIIKISQGCQW